MESTANDTDGLAMNDVWQVLGRRKRWVFGLPILFVALALAYSLLARPAYTSSAQIYVDPRDRPMPKEQQVSTVPGDGLFLVESQLKIITSDDVLSKVVDKLDLQHDREFGAQTGLFSTLKGLAGIRSPAVDPALVALRNLRLKTNAKRADRSFVIDVLASAETPERAVQIANTIAETYLQSQIDAGASFNKRTSESISSRLEDLRQAVQKSENEVEAFRSANNLIGARSKMVTEQQLDEVNTQLTIAKSKLGDAQAKVKQLEQAKRDGSLSSLPEAVQSATIAQLRAQSANVTREKALLAQQYGPSHPSLLAVEAQGRDIESAINAELARIGQSARNEATRAQSNVSSLQSHFDALKTQQVTNDKAMVPLRELERKAEANRGIYEAFLAKAKTAEESQAIDTNNERLISKATPAEQKSWPPTLILIGAGLFGGLALGVALALLSGSGTRKQAKPAKLAPEFVEPAEAPVVAIKASPVPEKIATPEPSGWREELGSVTPVAPVAAPVLAAVTPAPQAPAKPAETGETQIAKLAQQILAHPPGHVTALVQFGTADSGELAIQLAEQVHKNGKVVLLIDGNRSRKITSRFGFDDRAGLQDILNGRVSIYDAARYHRASQLNIVPGGSAQLLVSDAEAADALDQAIQAARDFDIVIIDTGSLDNHAEEFDLIAYADETLVLAPESAAGEAKVNDILQHLQSANLKARAVYLGGQSAAA